MVGIRLIFNVAVNVKAVRLVHVHRHNVLISLGIVDREGKTDGAATVVSSWNTTDTPSPVTVV